MRKYFLKKFIFEIREKTSKTEILGESGSIEKDKSFFSKKNAKMC